MQQHVNSMEVIMENYKDIFGARTLRLKKFLPATAESNDYDNSYTIERVDFGVSEYRKNRLN